MSRFTSLPPGELVIFALALLSIMIPTMSAASDEIDVAKAAKERNDDAESGNSDHELPTEKLSCHHRMYDWEKKTQTVTCDSVKHKCAYVHISYYNSENKLIHLLSQHCNHILGPSKRQSHCEAMKNLIMDQAATPYTKCEMKECDKSMCNVPLEGGMRPAWIVLIALSSVGGIFLCLLCICCCITCSAGPAEKLDAKGKPNAQGGNLNRASEKNTKGRMKLGQSEKRISRDEGQSRGVRNNNSSNNNNGDGDCTNCYDDIDNNDNNSKNNDNNINNNNDNDTNNTGIFLQMNDEPIPDLVVVDAEINVFQVEKNDSELFPQPGSL